MNFLLMFKKSLKLHMKIKLKLVYKIIFIIYQSSTFISQYSYYYYTTIMPAYICQSPARTFPKLLIHIKSATPLMDSVPIFFRQYLFFGN